MSAVFLKAQWRKLIMANYPVDPVSLKPFLPIHTELDTWEGNAYVSLVGFQFREVRVNGLAVPFHTRFPEVNLRFYVRHRMADGKWKRGVVFIREIVPLPVITLVANNLFHERYMTLPMRYSEDLNEDLLEVGYHWKYKGRWNELSATAKSIALPLEENSKEEFITEHFWGYAHAGTDRTVEYQVAHPRWDIYRVNACRVVCDFGMLYGSVFSTLESRAPQSVFLAEGSPVEVFTKSYIN